MKKLLPSVTIRTFALVGVNQDGSEDWLERFDINTKRAEIEKSSRKYQNTYLKGHVYLLGAEDNIMRIQFYLWGYHKEDDK